jgi:hypothetical protein
MNGRNWFFTALLSAALASAGVVACGGGDEGDKDGKGGTGGTGEGGTGGAGEGGTGGGGNTYDPTVDCTPLCEKLVEGCFHRGDVAGCVETCAAATTSKNVLQACGACVAANECTAFAAECFGSGKPCSVGGVFDLSLKGSGFTAFEDATVNASLVEGGVPLIEGTAVVTMGAFGVRFTGAMKEGRAYRVDYYIDVDDNKSCDPTDEVGTEDIGYAEESVTVTVQPGAAEPEGCESWESGTGGTGGSGPSISDATCVALSECCESPDEEMDAYRGTCRAVAESNNAEQCQGPLDMFIRNGLCNPSIECQQLALCCASTDFGELTVGCELAAATATKEICTELLEAFVGLGYCGN